MLHDLEAEGLLVSERWVVKGKMRKYYRLINAGAEALDQSREKAIELLHEICDEPMPRCPGAHAAAGAAGSDARDQAKRRTGRP